MKSNASCQYVPACLWTRVLNPWRFYVDRSSELTDLDAKHPPCFRRVCQTHKDVVVGLEL